MIDKLKTLWEWVKKFKLVNNAIEATKAGIGKIKEFFNFGSQVKTKQEFETEIDKRTKEVQAGAGAVPEFNQGAGVNTDYLLFSDDKKTKKGRSKGSDTYKHNGYYLKSTSPLAKNNSDNNTNIYSDTISQQNDKMPEKSIEERILETLIAIKNSLKGGNEGSKIEFNINKNSKEDIINEVTKDLVIALGNT